MKTVLPSPSDGRPAIARRTPKKWGRMLAQGGGAVVVSGLVCLWVRAAFPDELRVRTDVVGFPIHSNFNIFAYFHNYYVFVLAFPLGVLVVYHLLGRRHRRRWPPPPGPYALAKEPALEELVDPAAPPPAKVAVARLLFNGTVVGLALALFTEPSRDFWLSMSSGAIGFATLAAAAAALRQLPLPGDTFRTRLAAANALGTSFSVLLLGGVSSVTLVRIQSDGTVDHVPWLPWPLAASLTLAVLAVIGRALRRRASDIDVRRTERRALLAVAAPVAFFLVFGKLAGPVVAVDFFHDGEALAAVRLVLDGAFPWRDVLLIHGPMHDVLRPALGLWLVDHSQWGWFAGQALLIGPLYLLAHYALAVRLFGRSSLFLLLTGALAINPFLIFQHHRFLLQPLVLVLLVNLLTKASKPRAAAFTLLTVIHMVLTPEAAYLVVAAGVVMVAFETYYRTPGERLADRYRRTLWSAAFAVAILAAFFLYLAANGALAGFFYYYRTFAPDHALTGGIPMNSDLVPWFRYAMIAPPLLALITLWYVAAAVRSRRPLVVADWVMVAVAFFALAYYQKFLSRADGHVYHAVAATVPLLYWALHKAITALEGLIRRRPGGERILRRTTRHPVALAAMAVVLVLPRTDLTERLRTMPTRFQTTVPAEPELDAVGYSFTAAANQHMVSDMDRLLHAILRPDDRLFDMSNNPALFYYLLDTRPVKRYYHVSMAIRSNTQRDLLRQLRRERPAVVILGGSTGLPSWDGIPNFVRHYAVSEYVLREYRPLLRSWGFMFLVRNDLRPPPVEVLAAGLVGPLETKDLLLDQPPCDWGYAPNFFSDPGAPSTTARGVDVPFRAGLRTDVHELTLHLPPGLALDQFNRLEIRTAGPIAKDSFVLSADPADDAPSVRFKTLDSDSRRYRVRVGSCPQWHAFGPGTLSLRHDSPQEIVAVRVY